MLRIVALLCVFALQNTESFVLNRNHARSKFGTDFELLASKNNVDDVLTRPTVLVGFSGAGKELPRLANAIIEMTSGMSSAELSLLRSAQASEEDADINDAIDDMDCGVMEPIGRDEMGLYTYDTDIFDELIIDHNSLTQNDVVLLDFSTDLIAEISPENSNAAIIQKYLELLRHLKKLNCLVIYINVHPDKANLPPKMAALSRELSHEFVKNSQLELAIADEGLSAAAILARDALGEGSIDGSLPDRNVADFDKLLNDLETSSDPANNEQIKIIERHNNKWKDIIWDLKRLVLFGRDRKKQPLLDVGVDTFFTSLTFGDVREAEPFVSKICPDCDAMEFRADLIDLKSIISKEEPDIIPTESIGDLARSYEGRFHLLRQVGLLRRLCRPYAERAPTLAGVLDDVFPIVYTVRTANQAGTWPDETKKDLSDMAYVLQLGLRAGVEHLDIEALHPTPEPIVPLLRLLNTFPQTLSLASHHIVGQSLTDEQAELVYEGCMDMYGIGCDAVKVVLSMPEVEEIESVDPASAGKPLSTRGRVYIDAPNAPISEGTDTSPAKKFTNQDARNSKLNMPVGGDFRRDSSEDVYSRPIEKFREGRRVSEASIVASNRNAAAFDRNLGRMDVKVGEEGIRGRPRRAKRLRKANASDAIRPATSSSDIFRDGGRKDEAAIVAANQNAAKFDQNLGRMDVKVGPEGVRGVPKKQGTRRLATAADTVRPVGGDFRRSTFDIQWASSEQFRGSTKSSFGTSVARRTANARSNGGPGSEQISVVGYTDIDEQSIASTTPLEPKEGESIIAPAVLNDNEDVTDLAAQAERAARKVLPSSTPYIGLILGEDGQYSRVVNRRFTPVTHNSLPFIAAPGQLSSMEIMSRRKIDPKRFCILGHNISYSVSPQMHNKAFEVCKLPHTYGRADVSTVEEFVNSELWSNPSFAGASVTIPHKQSIMAYLDNITVDAKSIGAVNTIIIGKNGEKFGDNTDWIGIYNPIARRLRSMGNGSCLILGAGGTARAAAYAAIQMGLHPIYYNRTPSKAEELSEHFGGTVIPDLDEVSIKQLIKEHGDIKATISTLPAAASFEFDQWFFNVIPQRMVLLDVNYKPFNTPLILQCMSSSKCNIQIVRGSEMLWEQGVEQFERWMSRRAPYGVMKDIVLENCVEV